MTKEKSTGKELNQNHENWFHLYNSNYFEIHDSFGSTNSIAGPCHSLIKNNKKEFLFFEIMQFAMRRGIHFVSTHTRLYLDWTSKT